MTPPPFRDQVVAPLTWVAAGCCWTVQLLLPWTSAGVLSASSQVDGFRLLRSGVVSSVAPGWVAYLLLVVPVAGLLLVALGALSGRVASRARLVLAVVGVAMLAVALHALVSFDPTRLGPGGWTAVAGSALAVAAALLDRSASVAPVPLLEVAR